MKKIIQIFSCILLLLNPGCGMMIVGSIIHSCQTGTYWWIPALIVTPFIIWGTLSFYFYMYKEEHTKQNREYIKWKAEFSITHDLISEGNDEYGDYSAVWINKKTGRLIETG